MSVLIQEYQPDELLSPYIDCYREGTFNTYSLSLLSQKVVPHGYIDLIIHLSDKHCEMIYSGDWKNTPDFTLIGMWTQSYNVQFRHKVDVFSIRFKPEGIYELFNIPASQFGNNQADSREILGKSFDDLCSKIRDLKNMGQRIDLANSYLKKQLFRNSKGHRNYVQLAADIIRQEHLGLSIDELSDKVCISPRQLEREFKKKIGVSPKFYSRMIRVNQVHRMLSEEKDLRLVSVAHHCGYADQAHFIRDFKVLTGDVPTLFLNERDQFIVT
jgi:AraC-like DNA-binding protein